MTSPSQLPENEDKEWQAHLDLIFGEWKPKTTHIQLRMIVQYARSGRFYPTDMHVELIERIIEADRKEQRQALVENTEVSDLMAEYFSLKDEDKSIRGERNEYLNNNKCLMGDCIKRLKESQMGCELCEVCTKRNDWYMHLKKLSHKRAVIIKKVKKLTALQQVKDNLDKERIYEQIQSSLSQRFVR